MSVRRLIGLETEYGIHAPANPRASHVALSIELINAYAAHVTENGGAVAGTEWDYQSESPLVDARGWVLPRSAAHSSQLTDDPHALRDALGNITGGDPSPADSAEQEFHAPGSAHWRGDFFELKEGQPQLLMNLVLGNGARFYVDHAHPEYSAPEAVGAKRAVLYDVAGDVVVRAAADRLAQEPGAPEVLLYKNNTDNKSVSYGAHENYLVPRSLPFDQLVTGLLPFFASRQVICGAGRVGIGQRGQAQGFQISQRADFFEEQVGLETTVRRPIINTRDEPHAHFDSWRRLHVIIGDANMSEYSAWLRVGSTALVLDLIEAGEAPEIRLYDPVQALRTISHDPTLTAAVPTNRGPMTALQIQQAYLEAAVAQLPGRAPDTETAEVIEAWQQLLTDLAEDPALAADRVDWVAKLQLLESYRRRDGLDWDSPRLGMIDLQYHDLRPEKGLYYRLAAAGRMRRLFTDDQVAWAAQHPPEETRAWLRGQLVSRHGQAVAGASWDQVLLRPDSAAPPVRLHLPDPFSGTRAQAETVLDEAADSQQLVEGLQQLLN
ncbi:depupylase/deamidase Dop [Nesterenkonia alkaliphila]|uniref:Proteasome accessory factor PafA2 n=1 Tax=Nesterenkonia alkaliphila TaxID=1463631 RepID=A0A7K1UM95_9MICC|nr:depupylase/deamidase Dop [Nesterenkonia alkaliphila]MVT27583.1 proteasome accessory factor PafA2 [Nesterenkonia alkaliphila]GFZ79882.1 proteasome accessory factor PafA2 [Nesterenkonia alkaliphila]